MFASPAFRDGRYNILFVNWEWIRHSVFVGTRCLCDAPNARNDDS
jgi:hypothetical protein